MVYLLGSRSNCFPLNHFALLKSTLILAQWFSPIVMLQPFNTLHVVTPPPKKNPTKLFSLILPGCKLATVMNHVNLCVS